MADGSGGVVKKFGQRDKHPREVPASPTVRRNAQGVDDESHVTHVKGYDPVRVRVSLPT